MSTQLDVALGLAERELDQWCARLRFEDLSACAVYPRGAERSYVRLPSRAGCEVWLISWPPGSRAPLHDHGEASALATVLSGELSEWLKLPEARPVERIWRSHARLEIPTYARHEVWNASEHTAYSLHVYTPHLDSMTYYERTASGELRALHREEADQW
ncbi:MAG: cysteine dioxygenase family protein [Polyangiales bacterium]